MSGFTPLQEDCFSPQQAMQLIARTGEKKAHIRIDKFIYNSVLAGPLLGFGCAASLVVGASPWYGENAPGVQSMLAALVFPIGLVSISLTGAELWTSTVMYTSVAMMERRASILDLVKTWSLAWISNLGGMLFFLFINCVYAGVFKEQSLQDYCVMFAIGKAQEPTWYNIFCSAIGANWLVCIAVFQGTMARDVVSKIIAIWWPIFIFVLLGLDHVIANMFLVPVGIYYGAPFGVGYFIWKSLIPATLGNTIGGVGFVGVSYWYLHMTADEAASAEFDKMDTAAITGAVNGAIQSSKHESSPEHSEKSREFEV